MKPDLRGWLVACSLMLSGCLLPQPDTPIIPPPVAPGSDVMRMPAPVSAPQGGSAVAPSMGGAPIANSAPVPIEDGTTKVDLAQPSGTLSGEVKGLTAKRVTAVPEQEGLPSVAAEVDAAGHFSLTLPGGAYFLELAVGDQVLRVDQRVQVYAEGTRRITLTLQTNPPKATLTEEAPLVSPSPSPSPSASPKAN